MDMILNTSAQKEFDVSLIDTIVPDDSYPIRKETHPRGRIVFMSGDSSRNISDDTDLSWLKYICLVMTRICSLRKRSADHQLEQLE